MRTRIFVVLLVLAAAGAFAGGWWYRGRAEPTPEARLKESTEHMRRAIESLTR